MFVYRPPTYRTSRLGTISRSSEQLLCALAPRNATCDRKVKGVRARRLTILCKDPEKEGFAGKEERPTAVL
jgi:hypothetical protein